MQKIFLIFVSLIVSLTQPSGAQDSSLVKGPVQYVFSTVETTNLKAYIFSPSFEEQKNRRPAIVIFHGGGWYMGSPEWAFGRARHFAELGLVAVAAQYRLSSPKTGVTPIEAMADARAVIRWLRANADDLGIVPDSIAAYGWSAGAHLAACTAIFEHPEEAAVSCRPDALILTSPAVSLHQDRWLRKILGSRASPNDISPDMHVRAGMPPTLILLGRTDTVTPLAGTQRFHDRMLAAGNQSELIIYDGVGHLFTPSTESDKGWPNPDPEVRAKAIRKTDEFLTWLGFTNK